MQSECNRELFLGKTFENSHHFGSARSVNVCKPANELSSTNEKIHPSAPPISDNHVCNVTLTRGERESARVSHKLTHTRMLYCRLMLRPRKNPSPWPTLLPYPPGHHAPKVDVPSLPGSVHDGDSELLYQAVPC